jgi:hypothetical protein
VSAGGGSASKRRDRRLWLELPLLALVFIGYLAMARHYSSDVPEGSDWWGYVSQAVRLSHGSFYEPERVLSRFGLPENAGLTFPLAYTPKGPVGTVPTYPFGYPLLMAAAITLAGAQAAFWVTPILAAGALLLTYALGRAALGRAGGVIAALLLGVLPSFLLGAFQPLSDVPATFFAALALLGLLVLPERAWADVLLGGALGFGFWVRPNLGLLIGVVAVWLMAQRKWRRLLRVAAVVAPFLAVEALVNWHLYGAPWQTGYGRLALGGPLLQSLARGGRHLLRLNAQQGGAGLLAFALALVWNRLAPARRLLLAGTFAAFLVFFAMYRFDNAWPYFRFLVPAMPAVVVLEAGFLVRVTDPGRLRRLRAVAAGLATCAIALGSLRYAHARGVFIAKEGEQRFPRAAAFVASEAQRPALVLAMQQSGSLRYYTEFPIGRYDLGSPERLADTLVKVARAGGNVYLAVEGWEIERIVNGGRGFLLAGARRIGGTGDLSLFRLNPERIAERVRRMAEAPATKPPEAVFGGGWTRGGEVWHLRDPGSIGLPAGAEPALARVCSGEEAVTVRRPGFPDVEVSPHRCTDVPLLPGPSGRLSVSPLGAKAVTLPAVLCLPPAALRFQDQLSTAYMVPQVARHAGREGSFWQTDLLLVNPQEQPLQVSGLLLSGGRGDGGASAATAVLAPGAVLDVKDILRLPEYAWVGGLGAMLVHAGTPGKPCTDERCRFLVCARTYDVGALQETPDSGEWLPGLPFDAGMTGGRASFPDVAGGQEARASVGMASWTDHPVRVVVRAHAEGRGDEVREESVPTFGHLRIGLGAWVDGGTVEVEVVGSSLGVRLFPYVSVVYGEGGATCHLLPEAAQREGAPGPPPMPRVISGELRKYL